MISKITIHFADQVKDQTACLRAVNDLLKDFLKNKGVTHLPSATVRFINDDTVTVNSHAKDQRVYYR